MWEVARWVLENPKWLNATLGKELCMEACITMIGIMVALLQQHPERPREWALLATWEHCLEALKESDSHILLSLKVLCEGAFKLLKFTAFLKHLTMRVSRELHAPEGGAQGAL